LTSSSPGRPFNEWALNNAEHVHTSRGPHGPTAPGENFTRADKRYPQIGPDGRLIHTIDAEARAGYQGGGSVKRTAIHNGRDKHTLIASGHFPDGTAFPALPRSYVLRPGNNDKPQAAIDLIDHARRCNATITYNSVDLGYLNEDPHVLTLPAALRGVQLVSEHRKVHHRQRLYAPGVLDIDGGFFTTGTPTALQTLPQHTRDMTHKQHVALARRYDTRTAYMFRPNGTTATGRKRFRGPALPDRLTRNDAGTVTATPGVKVACPNARYYHLAPKDAPETTCTPGEACGCSTTFSAAPADIPAIHQTPAYGTTAWQRSYGRRNLAESFNARDQYHRRVGKHSIKVLPPRYNFAHALLTIGLLIDAIYSFVMRLGARDIDTQHWDHLDPTVTKACFTQLLTPEPKPHAKKRTKQDTS
jgi:hypothetical protein